MSLQQRRLPCDSSDIIATGVTGTAYQDTTVQYNTGYYYLVTSVNADGTESAPSNQAQATTPDTPPNVVGSIEAQGVAIGATAGQEFNGTVATFTGGDGAFSISISWGDGTTSGASVQGNPNSGYTVTGQHTYGTSGEYNVVVTINDGAQGGAAGSTATVSDTPGLYAHGAAISGQSGQDTGSVNVATLFSPYANLQPGSFQVVIDWGDGNSSVGTVTSQPDSNAYPVTGNHIYETAGDFSITVGITEDEVGSCTADSTANIAPASLGGAVISNAPGALAMGVSSVGNLIGVDSQALEYLPTGETAIGPVPDGDNWGVADETSGVSGYTAGVGAVNMSPVNFSSSPSSAFSEVSIGSTFTVAQGFHPVMAGSTVDPDLYQVYEYVTNTTDNPVHLLYRRTIDWAIPPYDQTLISNQQNGGPDDECVYDSNDDNDDNAMSNPLGPYVQTAQDETPPDLLKTGTFSDSGPGELASMFQFDFGTLPAHTTQTFSLFFGAAPSESQAISEIKGATDNGTFSVARQSDKQTAFMFGYLNGEQLRLDMNLDANNNGTIDAADEPLKDTNPGKVIVADTLDQTGSQMPGYADFSTSISPTSNNASVAPVTLSELDDLGSNYPNAKIRFDYSAADPNAVTRQTVAGSDLPLYTPGSSGELRLWTSSGSGRRNPSSILNTQLAGNYIPDWAAIPLSTLISQGTSATIYAEGINPGDPYATRVQVDIDPNGNGDWAMHDYVRFTVAGVQLVYTDVSGITHDQGQGMVPVPRIGPSTQPEGIAADWKSGVDDGSLLLLRLVGSPAITNLANNQHSFSVSWGETGSDSTLHTPASRDGALIGLDGGLVSNGDQDLQELGIETVGAQWADTNMTVLAGEFYRPPTEFLPFFTNEYWRLSIGAQVNLDGHVAAVGAKPEGLMLTRPPLVLVHGINSDPGVWLSTSGGTSFVQAAENAGYPMVFRVDHTGPDPVTGGGSTDGEGEISHMYHDVEDTIATATGTYRSGSPFPKDPYSTDGSVAGIAVQKVDIVAHSYGGLLARWYVEMSPEYESRRDVRNLIELGTPNLGSPLANMVDEVYSDPVIANARANGVDLLHVLPAVPTMSWAMSWMQSQKYLEIAATGSNVPRPFFQDGSVGSLPLTTLNANPFNDDVGYAAVVGENNLISNGVSASINLFSAMQPMWYPLAPGGIQLSMGKPYFPWLYQFDGGDKQSDGIVPVWSASLGVPAYNFPVTTANHIELVQSASVQQQVFQWLADPNIPLGSAQRAGWLSQTHPGNQPPVDDANAYKGANSTDSHGNLTGGGLNPDAIVGVRFGTTGLAPATWDTTPDNVGIHTPTLTGMIKIADIADAVGHPFSLVCPEDATVLQNLGAPGIGPLTIDAGQLSQPGGTVNDWVAFQLSTGTLGRRHDQILTGPNGTGPTESVASVQYDMADIPGGESPPTEIYLPSYSLPVPAPTINSGIIHLAVSGAVEWQAPASGSQLVDVDIYAKSGDGLLQAGPVTITAPTGA